MLHRIVFVCTLIGAALLAEAVSAQCTEDPRTMQIGTQDEPNTIRLKSFLCRTRDAQQDLQIKLEFHRLSEAAASMAVSRRVNSQLRTFIGSPQVAENEVYRTYADLLQRFGSATEANSSSITLTAAGGGGHGEFHGSDSALDRSIRAIIGIKEAISYPAIDEILAIRSGAVPEGMRYNNYVYCEEPSIWLTSYVPNDTCRSYTRGSEGLIFWRSMRSSDASSFSSRLSDYNRRMGQKFWTRGSGNKMLQLARYVAGENWPDNFLVLLGYDQTCTPDAIRRQGSRDWITWFWMREILLDVVLIENLSNAPLALNDLIGARFAAAALREASSLRSSETSPLGFRPITLPPRGRLLVPTRITFGTPKGLLDMFRFQKTYDALHARFGMAGFRGNPQARGVPELKSYVYGPAISVTGLVANGMPIDLARPSANFIDLALSRDEGSCPYLLSRDERDQEWIDHGKILHHAPTRETEYSEIRVFPGFRSHFRLEEREPEVAFIRGVDLHVLLKSGRVLSLVPDSQPPRAEPSAYVEIYWGEFADFRFSLPDDAVPQDVVESTLRVTGYYERYSARLAESPARPRFRLLGKQFVAINSTQTQGLFCPRPWPQPDR